MDGWFWGSVLLCLSTGKSYVSLSVSKLPWSVLGKRELDACRSVCNSVRSLRVFFDLDFLGVFGYGASNPKVLSSSPSSSAVW